MNAKAKDDDTTTQHISADEHVPGGLEVRQAMDTIHNGMSELTNSIGRLKERLIPVLSSEKSVDAIRQCIDYSAPLANEIGGHGRAAEDLAKDVDAIIEMLQV